jgi:hypothetical protein
MPPSVQAELVQIGGVVSNAYLRLIGLQARASRKPITWEVIKSRICPPKSARVADCLSLGAKSGASIGTMSNTAQSGVVAQKARTNERMPNGPLRVFLKGVLILSRSNRHPIRVIDYPMSASERTRCSQARAK